MWRFYFIGSDWAGCGDADDGNKQRWEHQKTQPKYSNKTNRNATFDKEISWWWKFW